MFGRHVRQLRERKKRGDRSFSLRQVAARIGVEPAYLSKVERGMVAPPSEEKIIRLARELEEDADVFLSLAGKVSSDVLAIIRRHPQALAGLVRNLRNVSEMKIVAMSQPGKGGMK